MASTYDVIIVGTGFASSFFLASYLEKAGKNRRVLVLERGRRDSHDWQIDNRRNSSIPHKETFVNDHPRKEWRFNIGFGGGSNCWWACTPRMMPNDFRMHSTYGVGRDWPIRYGDLEPFYCQAEEMMAVSGPDNSALFPRSKPYPQPPHRFSDPDRILKKAYPGQYFPQPTARARRPTENRPMCCASGVCNLCPVDAKFTIQNEMSPIYDDPRVTLRLKATVQTVETRAGRASGVTYKKMGKIKEAHGDLVVLGANALFNPYILMRSGIDHPLLGKNLHEQVSVDVIVDLDGVDNFQGSTSITGHGYMLYDGPHRSEHAGCLIESWNVPRLNHLRTERGKWRQRLLLRFIFEDLPQQQNYVTLSTSSDAPKTVFTGRSDYVQRAIDRLPEKLPELLHSLPIERIDVKEKPNPTEAHIMGTTVMGNDPETSVVDRHLIHHKLRNVVVLGSGAFPTGAPANPTLTLSALSLWSANHLFA